MRGISFSPAFLAAAVGSIFLLALIIRRRYFSSISDVPGPFIGSFSILWQIWHTIKGHTEEETIALHQKCGKSLPQNPLYAAKPWGLMADLFSQGILSG